MFTICRRLHSKVTGLHTNNDNYLCTRGCSTRAFENLRFYKRGHFLTDRQLKPITFMTEEAAIEFVAGTEYDPRRPREGKYEYYVREALRW